MFEFAQAGGFVTDWDSLRGVTPDGIDVDAAGNLYVLTGGGSVEQFTAPGTDVGPVNGDASDPTGLAVDRSNNEVYMDSGGVLIRHYPSSCDAGGNCTAADSFGSGHLSGATGLAVDPSNDSVYAASSSAGQIEKFTGPVILADVSTSAPSSLHGTTATLSGHLDPAGGGNVTSCQFEYGPDTTYGQTMPCSPAGPYSTPADVGADISGLAPNTTYHFRLDVVNAQGQSETVDQTFTTLGPVIDGLSTANVSARGVSLQAQINPNGQDTTYHFEYINDASFQATGFTGATSIPTPDGDLSAVPGDQPVQQDISSLALATLYHYRVVASNSDATVTSAAQSFTTLPAVQIDSTSAREVASTSATLDAQVNPDGLASTYQFQYVDDASFQASGYATATSLPTPAGEIGAGLGDVAVSQHLQGLRPGITYHYRLIAVNESAAPGINSPDHTFTTQATTDGTLTLPDNRGYELVTPANKGGGSLAGVQLSTSLLGFQASADGDKLTYSSITAFPGSQAGGNGSYLGSRGPTGWSSQPLDPPQATSTSLANGPWFGAFSPDLSKAVFIDGGGPLGQDSPPLVGGEPLNTRNVFIRDNLTNTYQLVDLTRPGVSAVSVDFQGASADLGHVVFSSPAPFTPDVPSALSGVQNIYQWVGGSVSLVSQIPTAPAVTCGGSRAPCAASTSNASPGAGNGTPTGYLGAVSNDGSNIFFTTTTNDQLYVRESGIRTVRYSASQKTNGAGPGGTDANGPHNPEYRIASSDGSKVFFSSCEQLTNHSTAVSPGAGCFNAADSSSGEDLYQYDVGSGVLTDLTVDRGPDVSGADVQGVLGASTDGSYVYFVANGVLAGGARPGDCGAQPGNPGSPSATCSVYVRHDGTTRFIATVSGYDSSDWDGRFTARVTPDGTHVAFESIGSVTGYDNAPVAPGDCTDPVSGLPLPSCDEVYLYSAATGQLTCASCNPSGARPVGPASIPPAGHSNPADGRAFPYLTRNLSVDGRRLFFDSQDALVPGDGNGRSDVYEYEGAAPHLILSGTGNSDSQFVDASQSGDNVFVETSAQLVGQDVDQSLDVYDARVGGGFQFSGAPVACSGDACRPPGSGVASGLNPGSATFVGSGDQGLPVTGSVVAVKARGVRVLGKAGGGSRLMLRVSVPGRGRVSVTGSGVKRFSKALSRGGTYRVVVGLTAAERKTLKRRHRLKVMVHVRFEPVGGRASTVTVSVMDKA